MNNNVLIIMVNFRRPDDTCACVDSLLKLDISDWNAVICENDSKDHSAVTISNHLKSLFPRFEHIKPDGDPEIYRFYANDDASARPKVTLVVSPTNLGFAGGNNLAYKIVTKSERYDYYWFLNNDTVVEPDALSHMLKRMAENKKIGICGSTLLYEWQRDRVQALGGACYGKWTSLTSEIGNGTSWPQTVPEREIEKRFQYVSGASMLVSAQFIQDVGLMSEDYFLYFEELDWAERGRKRGYELGYASRSVVYHKEGAALGSGKSHKRSDLAEYYNTKNKLKVTLKYFPYALPSVVAITLLQILKRVKDRQWSRAKLMVGVLFGMSAFKN